MHSSKRLHPQPLLSLSKTRRSGPLWPLLLLCALTWNVLVLQWDRGNAPRLGEGRIWPKGSNKHTFAEVRESLGEKLKLWSLHWHLSQGALLAPNTTRFLLPYYWCGSKCSSGIWDRCHGMHTSALFYEDISIKLEPMIPFPVSPSLLLHHTGEKFMPVLPGNDQTIHESIPVKRSSAVPSVLGHSSSSHWFCCPSRGEPHLENYWCPAVHYGHHWELAYGLVKCD